MPQTMVRFRLTFSALMLLGLDDDVLVNQTFPTFNWGKYHGK